MTKIWERYSPKLAEDKFDAIIIGSGMGGLSTAAFLSKAGKKVLVLERHLPRFLELGEPFRSLAVFYLVKIIDQVNSGKGTNCWSGQINDRDEPERPAGGLANGLDILDGKETDDDMG